MALTKNHILLFISCYLLISFHLVRPESDPDYDDDYLIYTDAAPPVSNHLKSPAASPSYSDADAPLNYISYAPLISEPPSKSVSEPPSEGPSPSESVSFDVDPKLDKICVSTDHPELCKATIAPLLHKKEVNVPSVLEVSINAGNQFANHVLSLVKEFAKKPGTSEDLASVLSDCKDSFDDVVSDFESAMEAFPKRDVGTMNSMLSAVITSVGDCEDAIASLGTDSPISTFADKLTNMTSNSLAIASLMH